MVRLKSKKSQQHNGRAVDKVVAVEEEQDDHSADWSLLPLEIHFVFLQFMPLSMLFGVCNLVCKSWRNYIVDSRSSLEQNLLWFNLSRERFGVHDYRIRMSAAQEEERRIENLVANDDESATDGDQAADMRSVEERQLEISAQVEQNVDWKRYYVVQHMFEKYHKDDPATAAAMIRARTRHGRRTEPPHIDVETDYIDERDMDGHPPQSSAAAPSTSPENQVEIASHMIQIVRNDRRPKNINRHTLNACYPRDPVTGVRKPLLVIIGNYTIEDDLDGDDDGNVVYQDLLPIVHVYDLDTKMFSPLDTTGDEPEAMVWRHTACTFNHSKIAVFGGSRRRTEKLNDLRILDIETKHWQLIDAPNAPSRRSDHSAAMAQDRWLYVFGGSNVDVRPMNDLHCFDTQTMTWSGELQVHGPRPPSRSGCQMAYIASTHQLCMFGGGVWSRVIWSAQYNDAWLFDIASGTWLKIDVHGSVKPQVGTFPGVTPVDHFLFVIGGGSQRSVVDHALMLNTITMEWKVMETLTGRVSCDGAGVCALLEEEIEDDEAKRHPHKSNCMFLYGGYAGRSLDHFFRITMQWRSKAMQVLRMLEPWSLDK